MIDVFKRRLFLPNISHIPGILISVMILFFGFSIGARAVYVKEIFSASLILVLLLFLAAEIPAFANRNIFVIDQARAVAFSFAAVSTVQAMSHIVDIDLPRFKVIYRLVLFSYTFFLFSGFSKKLSRFDIILSGLFIFTSYPFIWVYLYGTLKSIPLFLLVLFLVFDNISSAEIKDLKNDFIAISSVIAFIAFFLSNVYLDNYIDGFNFFLQLLVGIGIYAVVKYKKHSGYLIFKKLFFLTLFLHLLLFYASMINLSVEAGDYNPLLSKVAFLSGINVNDISGYLIMTVPVLSGLIFSDYSENRKLTTVRDLTLIFFSLFLLFAVKSRISWIVLILVLLFQSYFFLRMNHDEKWKRLSFFIFLFSIILVLASALVIWKIPLLRDYIFSTDTLKYRISLWIETFHVLLANPLAGLGAEGNYQILSRPESDFVPFSFNVFETMFTEFHQGNLHAHNTFLQLWIMGGLFFSLLFFAAVVFSLLRVIRNQKIFLPEKLFIAAGMIFAFLIQGLANYHLMDYPVWILLWSILAVSQNYDTDLPEKANDGNHGKKNSLLLLGILTLVSIHSFVLFSYSSALDLLSGNRRINPLGMIVLENESLDHAGFTRNLREADIQLNRSLFIYSSDKKLLQFSAEINSELYFYTGKKEYFVKAENQLKKLLSASPNMSHYNASYANLLKDISPEKSKDYCKRSRLLDPFGMTEPWREIPF